MAKSKIPATSKRQSGLQQYPRVTNNEDGIADYLDETALSPHRKKIDSGELEKIIIEAINYADDKSRREILFEIQGATEAGRLKKIRSEAKDLFKYFAVGDPATKSFDNFNKHFSDVAAEAYQKRVVHMGHMNSGWRYQYIANAAASISGRFTNVSGLNQAESDFVASVRYKDSDEKLNIYISVKNRINTIGGQNYPKIMNALEDTAKLDRNRAGPYICVFGIAIEKGMRQMRISKKTKIPYSYNAEIWMSDFFWKFFTNYSYEEICKAVLDVLLKVNYKSSIGTNVPEKVIKEFGAICNEYRLLDDGGKFNSREKLIRLFCSRKNTIAGLVAVQPNTD